MPDARPTCIEDLRDACFVIMPFGKREVALESGGREIDFDAVYRDLFRSAIASVRLPDSEGGGCLRPIRADDGLHSTLISQEMFEFIEYSRFVIADITAVNANVFYELGARHRAHAAGTALFRQVGAPIPFDIKDVRAFPYAIEPQGSLDESRARVTQVLTDSLERNAWDSPIRLALSHQFAGPENLQDILRDAEDCLRRGDLRGAHDGRMKAAEIEPENPLHYVRASMWTKSEGDWNATIRLLRTALSKEDELNGDQDPTYSEAYRELGIAKNKLHGKQNPSAGEEDLRQAVTLDPGDFDAWASLGGVLRRAGREEEALDAYAKSSRLSDGHPYPLLMEIKLRAKQANRLEIDAETEGMLREAKGIRRGQVASGADAPWSYFDLAEIYMYQGNPTQSVEVAKEGLRGSDCSWMPATFLSALNLLPAEGRPEVAGELKRLAQARLNELEG